MALQRVEPEKRSVFIKETLRQALLGTHSEEILRLPQDKLSADIPQIHDDYSNYPLNEAQAEEVIETMVKQPETFSLDDLFTQTDAHQTDEEPVLVTEHDNVQSIPGFEYMMKYIIGTEDDETVLKVLNKTSVVNKQSKL